ncbi:MAG: hypothetical protein IT424_14890 [Pirellulales bacterium]|nr:hypothetical protein [Pirellulales bacterium]
MTRTQCRLVISSLVVAASLAWLPTASRAQLVPPGDFHGKSHDQWGLDWTIHGLRVGLGGESLPDVVDGVRYLPFSEGNDFAADVSIQPGTAVVFSPYVLFGEQYADGSEDDPVALADFINNTILGPTTIRTTLDGNVVLEGGFFDFPDRTFDITLFPEPIEYAAPNARFPAVAAYWATAITAIFDGLSPGEHTIVNVQNSPFFSPLPSVATYNITVVPEPAGLALAAVGIFVVAGLIRRQNATR